MNANTHTAVTISASKREIGITKSSVSGLFPFRDESIPFESYLEKDFLIRLESYKSVLRVESQPFTLEYELNGQIRSYTPDFLVWFRNYPWPFSPPHLIEVKPNKFIHKQLSDPINRAKYKAAFRFCKSQGFIFHFQDEYRIKDQRWRNAKFLQRFNRLELDTSVSNWLVESMESMKSTTVHHLLAKHFISRSRQALGLSHIWHLVASRQLECNMDRALDEMTEIWLPSDE